jgi:serine/threonine protein kinase
MGTPGYVAPEVLDGAKPSPRSDLYSLAVVAYRLLARAPATRAAAAPTTVPQPSAIPRMPPLAEVRPDLSRRVVDAVQQALARDPGARHDSVAEFHAQLVGGRGAPLRPRAAA